MPANASLRHVVLFAFKEQSSQQAIDTVVADFGRLPAEIPGITAFEWGTNVSPEGLDNGFTHCFTLSFAGDAERDAYLVHPAHQRFVESLGSCLERALVLDYWTQA
jgi:hypothetical protein